MALRAFRHMTLHNFDTKVYESKAQFTSLAINWTHSFSIKKNFSISS